MANRKLATKQLFMPLEPLEQRQMLSAAFADGQDNDMAYDPINQVQWLTYFEHTGANTGRLAVRSRPDGGTWSASTILDGGGFGGATLPASTEVGRYPAIAVDGNGNPGIAYYDAYNGDLRYIKFNGTSWGSRQTLEQPGTAGLYPSIVFNANNIPYISYYKKGSTAGVLRLAIVDGVTPLQTPDGSNDSGRYSSIKLEPGVGWAISYQENSLNNGQLRYVKQSGGTPTVIVASGVGGYTSLAFDGTTLGAKPAISYYDSPNTSLRFVKYGTSSWGAPVQISPDKAFYGRLWYNGSNPRVAFYNRLKNESQYVDSISGVWQTPVTIFSGGASEFHPIQLSTGKLAYAFTAAVNRTNTPVAPDTGNDYIVQARDEDDKNIGLTYTGPVTTGFTDRYLQGGAVFQNKVWIFGGFKNTPGFLGDSWSSTNGTTFTSVTQAGPDYWDARGQHQVVVSDDGSKMYLIGGYSNGGTKKDVYVTTNGTNWTRTGTNLAVLDKLGYSVAYHDGALWLLGGYLGTTEYGTIHRSINDGASWTAVTPAAGAGFTPRANFSAVSYGGSLWVVGGQTNMSTGAQTNSVYRMTDPTGTAWALPDAALNTSIPTRPATSNHSMTVFDSRMWLIGGNSEDDVWYSIDGANWIQANAAPSFGGRANATVVGFGGKLRVIAGASGGVLKSDAWTSV